MITVTDITEPSTTATANTSLEERFYIWEIIVIYWTEKKQFSNNILSYDIPTSFQPISKFWNDEKQNPTSHNWSKWNEKIFDLVLV